MAGKVIPEEHKRPTRLQEILAAHPNLAELSRKSGIQRRMLDRYKSDGTEPSLSVAALIARALDLSIDELVNDKKDRDGPLSDISDRAADDMMLIPRFSVEVSAGPGAQAIDFGELDPVPFPKMIFQRLGVNPRNCHVIQGRGDSMAPTIVDGGMVIVDASVRRFVGSGIYVFSLGEDVRLKRLEKRSDTGFSIISDNAALYPREELTTQQLYDMKFTIHGRVVWTEKVL